MFTQPYLNDSFMIRKIIVAAAPAALVVVGMSLAISEPVNACRRGCVPVFNLPNTGSPQMNTGGGGATNTNQVYPTNRRIIRQPENMIFYADLEKSFSSVRSKQAHN